VIIFENLTRSLVIAGQYVEIALMAYECVETSLVESFPDCLAMVLSQELEAETMLSPKH
jgi:hypothetical protein